MMDYSYAFEYAYDCLLDDANTRCMKESEVAFIAGDFAERCAGDVPGFPGLPETDNVRDEWGAYLRDIGGFSNFARYVAGRGL